MLILFCFFLLLPGQKAGQSIVQLSFNHAKADTLEVNPLLLIKWKDVRKEAGWFELWIQPTESKGWKIYCFLEDTKFEVKLAKGFVYNVMVVVKNKNDSLLRASRVRKIKVKF